jgi:hypothetical protein
MTSEEWAAWVQAIGTILAIGTAFWAGQLQVRAMISAERRANILDRAEKCKELLSITEVALSYLVVIESMVLKPNDERRAFFTGDGHARMERIAELLNASPMGALLDKDLMGKFIQARIDWVVVNDNVNAMRDHYTKDREIAGPANQLRTSIALIAKYRELKRDLEGLISVLEKEATK